MSILPGKVTNKSVPTVPPTIENAEYMSGSMIAKPAEILTISNVTKHLLRVLSCSHQPIAR